MQGWRRERPFKERQGDLSLISHVQMDAVNEQTISHFLSLLQEIMEDNDIPGQIHNVHKTRVPLDPKAPNVESKTGAKKVCYHSTGRKGQVQVTVVACGSDIGKVIPSTVLSKPNP